MKRILLLLLFTGSLYPMEQSLGFLLWHTSTQWRTSIEIKLKEFMLTHPQFVVRASTAWLTTRKGDVVSQIDIARMVSLDPNTTSQILRGLEKKKLIKRTQAIDEKRKNPAVTEAGAVLLAKALPAVEKIDVQFFKKITEKEADLLIAIFHKLNQPALNKSNE